LHQGFHLEAVYSQSEMDFSDIPDEEEGDEEEDAEDEAPAEVPARPQRPAKKSGPKDLAEFHAKQVN
jgi:Ran GTPase-activating protein (RanGAP) involved in mRNA processing and transport